MTASPKKSTAPKKPTSVAAWKKNAAEPVELPSGNYMRVRRMSMSTLMATGKMPNSLTAIVKKAVDKGTGVMGVESEMADLIGDEKQLREMAQFLDTLVTMVAVDPPVSPTPETEADRQDDVLYADEIEEEDKSFIFQLVTGGTTDVEQFRAAAEASMASVPGLQNLAVQAVGAPVAD